jgi:hypothetical protein
METALPGVDLQIQAKGVARAVPNDLSQRSALPWDRYMRFNAVAQELRTLGGPDRFRTVLDVGGADGAISLFLPEYDIRVCDPGTTGGDIFALTAGSYDAVLAVDVIEHVEPRQRGLFITQLAQLTRLGVCILNYPIPASSTAQRVVAHLTGDRFVQEHVKFGLPYSATVEKSFEDLGFSVSTHQHTSRAVWAAYFTLRSKAPADAAAISRYLIEDHPPGPVSDPLYETLVAIKP